MADHVQGLAQLEILCKQLYETTDTVVRHQAEKALVEFTNSPDCLSKCQLLLERGSSSYSQLLAATCLSKLVSRTSNPLPLEQRIDIRNYVLNYLATRPKLAAFVTQALIQLYARITKLGWFDCQKDEYVFRNVIGDVTRFLQDSVEHCIIGVMILSQLTNEINQADTTHPLTKHRKIASSFRDSSLFDIFTLSCNLLKQASGKNLNLNDESQHGLLMQLLKLSYNCLNYDFIGTSTDESSDDLCTVQIPTSWRSAFLDSSTLQLFFNLYHSIPPSLSPLVSRHVQHSNHISLFLYPAYRQELKQSTPVTRQVKLWTPEAENTLQGCFATTDWDVFRAAATREDSSVSIEDYAEYVTGYISTCVENIVPTIQVRKFPNQNPWVNRQVLHLLRTCTAAFRSGNEAEYKAAQYRVEKAIRAAKRQHREKTEDFYSNADPRRMWQCLDHITDFRTSSRTTTISLSDSLPDDLNGFYTRFESPIPTTSIE
ncbi:exportin-7-like [Thalassophryne amazonica]|uniref:exportin-7-like n=1 Tax=Thalassophryne amazonica TaxID=390379 RepID=UPI001471DC85|nr:exportin-7-like [Thalassophryne amazonica]